MVSEGWGDGMPIKTHAWFNGLRWDAVLLRQVHPVFTRLRHLRLPFALLSFFLLRQRRIA
jgi:hypothetical protein